MDARQVNRVRELIHGYMREKYSSHVNYEKFEVSLMEIILRLLGNIFIIFDVYAPEITDLISDNGKVFKFEKKQKSNINHSSYITFGCSYGWSKGVHKISVQKVNTPYESSAFGITTNIKYFNGENGKKWFGSSGCKDGYFYVLNGTGLASMVNGEGGNQYQSGVVTSNQHTSNDKITICIDLDNGKATFMYNDKQCGFPMKIEKNQTYHFFISSGCIFCGSRAEYHLITE